MAYLLLRMVKDIDRAFTHTMFARVTQSTRIGESVLYKEGLD